MTLFVHHKKQMYQNLWPNQPVRNNIHGTNTVPI
jgi:hypothetical protein